jgi:maltooligosyltrehalose trehalohydrolase
MLDWYRKLVALRRSHASAADPRRDAIEVNFDEDAGWLVFSRPGLAVVANIGGSAVAVPLQGFGKLLAASDPAVEVEGGLVCLPPDTVGVLGTG